MQGLHEEGSHDYQQNQTQEYQRRLSSLPHASSALQSPNTHPLARSFAAGAQNVWADVGQRTLSERHFAGPSSLSPNNLPGQELSCSCVCLSLSSGSHNTVRVLRLIFR